MSTQPTFIVTSPNPESLTVNDSSRRLYKQRFIELLCALNTQSQKVRFQVMQELVTHYHFGMISDEQAKYVLELFQGTSQRASDNGHQAADKGQKPREKKKRANAGPTFLPSNKFHNDCSKCGSAVRVGDAIVLDGKLAYCALCGIDTYPHLRGGRGFVSWETAHREKSSKIDHQQPAI